MTSDDLQQLADDYWEALLGVAPTWRHMLGDYSRVGDYEDDSREAEDRYVATMDDFAARADALPTDGLDEQQQLTRAMLAATARDSADYARGRTIELAADPVHGPQVSLPIIMPMLAIPDADAAEAMPAK